METYYEPVLALFIGLAGSATTGQDLAQSVFTGLLGGFEPIGDPARDRAYVFRSAYNCWNSWLRDLKQQPSTIELNAQDGYASKDLEPVDALCRDEQLQCVFAALQELPANQRAAFAMITLEQMPYGTVAEMLGVPRDTMAKWRTRALHRLRARLGQGPSRMTE